MAIIKKIETDFGKIGIWEIKESLNVLLNEFKFTENEKIEFEKISVEKRKKEFLISRLLLADLLGFKPEIEYEKSGRPILANSELKLSISHSAQIVVVFISAKRVGIDVENLERNVDKVAHRFIHEKEWGFVNTNAEQGKIKVLIWSGKEAIFKCCTEQGIQFNRQIIIDPFEIEKEGVLTGKRIKNSQTEYFKLTYFFYKNNVIVYCVEK